MSFSNSMIETSSSFLFTIPIYTTFNNKIKRFNKIGPHNVDILSIIFGNLLGQGVIKSKKEVNGTSITFFQEAMHVKYLLWLHNKLQNAGYCNPTVPTIGKRLGKKGKILKIIRFSTWSYTSFDFIQDLWYKKGIKIVPHNIETFLTPLALAIWIMDSGVKSNGGLKIINCYSYSECLLLLQVLHNKFELKATIQSTSLSYQYQINISKESILKLSKIVAPFIIPEMKYKLLPAAAGG